MKTIVYLLSFMTIFFLTGCLPTSPQMAINLSNTVKSNPNHIIAVKTNSSSRKLSGWNSWMNSKDFLKALNQTLSHSGLFSQVVILETESGNENIADFELEVTLKKAEVAGLPAKARVMVHYTLNDISNNKSVYDKTLETIGKSGNLIGGSRYKKAIGDAATNNFKTLLSHLSEIIDQPMYLRSDGISKGYIHPDLEKKPEAEISMLLVPTQIKNVFISGVKVKKDPIYIKSGKYSVSFDEHGETEAWKSFRHSMESDGFVLQANGTFVRVKDGIRKEVDPLFKRYAWETKKSEYNFEAGKIYLISELND